MNGYKFVFVSFRDELIYISFGVIIMDYKKLTAERIREHLEIDADTLEEFIEIPPSPEIGDFTFPCFKLVNILRKAPNIIAQELKEKINTDGYEKIEALGPYINFFVDKGCFSKNTITKILEEKEGYGSSTVGEGQSIIIEYSSPNIAKPLTWEHIYSAIIGNALHKLFSFEGYKCKRVNHLIDWGTQLGKLISAYKRWVEEVALEKDPMSELLRIYVKFHKEAEKNSVIETEGRMYFKKLQDGDGEARDLCNRLRKLSLKEFNQIYKALNIALDSWSGERFYRDKIDSVVKELEEKGLLVENNGAKVVMLQEYNLSPCIILKSDEEPTYAIIALTTAIYSKNTYNFSKSLYVFGKDQALYFDQMFKVLQLAGYDWSKNCVHVPFGLVKFTHRKFSGRKGNIILLDELLSEVMSRTLEVINEKNPSLEYKEEVAKKLGIGAIIFTCLKNNREKDIVFDWEEILNFDGETYPYVQYTYAKAKAILQKVSQVSAENDFSKLVSKEEFELVKTLAAFQKSILYAIEKLEPSVVTGYILDVARAFNKFYNVHSVTNTADTSLKSARIKLVEATCQVIKNGLELIGIEIVEKL